MTRTGAISFQKLAEIAAGDTARVELCRATSGAHAGQLLAVKRLQPHLAEDRAFSNQFMDEVWMTASLRHPNVVEVAGWGSDEYGMYLAVELVQGVSLARLMKTVFETSEVFTERMVVFIAQQICRGLSAAHKQLGPEGQALNLVHRDLTPGNVLLSFNGEVKIADFGVAKAKLRLTQTLTGELKGNPQYMAPEQARGTKDIDARADLFSLGCVLFELFTGRTPWVGNTPIDTMQAILMKPPADLRDLRPRIDRELVAIVTRCLEKDPAARFRSADEVLARLDTWLETHGYQEGNEDSLARFVRRNGMKQMRWFERAVGGEMAPAASDAQAAQTGAGWPPRPDFQVQSVITSAPIVRMNAFSGPTTQRSPQGQRSSAPESETVPNTTTSESVTQPRAAARLKAPPKPQIAIVEAPEGAADVEPEEDSDELSTLIKATPRVLVRPGSIPKIVGPKASAGAPPKPAPPRASAVPPAPKRPPEILPAPIDDEEATSEDQPTAPLKKEILAARLTIEQRAGRGLPGTVVSHSADVPPLPQAPAAPPVPAPFPQPEPGSPAPPAQVHPVHNPESETLPRGAIEAPRIPERLSSDDPRRAEATSRDAPQAREAKRQIAMQAAQAASAPAPVAPDPNLTKEVLRAEADRIVFGAARFGEEARIAMEVAERKATIAKLADRAASVAADAVSILSTSGLSEAARRFEEARAIDRQIQQELASLQSLNPPATSMIPPPPFAAPPASTRNPPVSNRIPTARVNPPPPAAAWLERPPAAPPQPAAFEPAFRPMLLGLPRHLVIAIIIVGAILILVLILVLAS